MCLGPEGLPRAGSWPEGRKPTTAGQGFANLEALAYAYELSGDIRFVRAGIGALAHAVDWIANPEYRSEHVFFHRMMRGPFPFFAVAHELGLLEKIPGAGTWTTGEWP